MLVTLVGIVGGVIAILLGISVYLMKTGKLSSQDWSKNALGLPQGSIRALLAFVVLFVVIATAFTGLAWPKDFPDWLIGILGMIIGFYFGAKTPAKPG